MATEDPRDVFLCYNRTDRDWVEALAAQIESEFFDAAPSSRKLRVYLDEWDLSVGDNIINEINRGLEESRHLAAVMTPEFFGSAWTNLEWTHAVTEMLGKTRGRIIPIYLRDTSPDGRRMEKLPAPFNALKLLDFRKSEFFPASYQRLIQHIRGQPIKRGDPQQPLAYPSRTPHPINFPVSADPMQNQRIRAFVDIVDQDLNEFGISLQHYPVELLALQQMIKEQRPCDAEGLKLVGAGLWKLESEITTKGGRHGNFDAFWMKLLDDLRLRFPRANDARQWEELKGVLKGSALEEPKWNDFLDRWIDPPFPVSLDLETTAAIKKYRRDLTEKFRDIKLSGFGGAAAQNEAEGKAELSKVYIDLDTKAEESPGAPAGLPNEAQHRQVSKAVPALQRLAIHQRLVLLGLPGSGKSTLLKYFSLCLAKCGLKPEEEWLKNLELWPEEERDLVPIFVELRQFISHQPISLPDVDGGQPLTNYILEQLKSDPTNKSQGAMLQALLSGRAIVFLDGLDEVPDDDDLRKFVLNTVNAFANGPFSDSRIVVTCRPRSYEDPAWRLEGFERAELAALTPKKIKRFIDRFYTEVARRDPQVTETVTRDRKAKLRSALSRKELEELATNPFMLTIMAWLHRFEELPRKRASILNTLVEQLLFKWEFGKRRDDKVERMKKSRRREDSKRQDEADQIQTLTDLLEPHGLETTSLRRVLCRLAFRAHENSAPKLEGETPIHAVSIPKAELLEELKRLLHPPNVTENYREQWALKVSQVIDQRTGLLVPEGNGLFTMPYKLQEFLAGEHLTDNDELEELGKRWGLPKDQFNFHCIAAQLVGANGYWEEIVKWAGAFQSHVKNNKSLARDLAFELCRNRPEDRHHDPLIAAAIKLRRAVVAQEILIEIGLPEVANTHWEHGPACLTKVRETLDMLMFQDGMTIEQHAAAGSARGWLEDLPPGIGLKINSEDEKLPDVAWIEIEAGEFLMGDEDFLLEARIDQPYWISRYPVTVAQYQAFVDDGLYEKKEFWDWSPEASQWFKRMQDEWYQENLKPGPENYGLIQTPNHPRVGISWFEAVAFCQWLNQKLRLSGDPIRLPTEEEWERVARGDKGRKEIPGHHIPSVKQRYNFSIIGNTSPVNLFPKGDTPKEGSNAQGVADLVGNAWEWCSTLWESPHSTIVARGGSWRYGKYPQLISPLRRGFEPEERCDDVGFRLVCSRRLPE